MIPGRLWCVLTFLALAGVARAAEPTTGEVPSSILLVRAPCDNFCPGYSVSISSDGTVVYDGWSSVAKLGRATKQVPVAALAPLWAKLREINFWAIDGQGDGRVMLANGNVTAAFPPNQAVYSVTVVQGGKSKQVQGIAGGRYAEGDLAALVDQAADIADWTKRSTKVDLAIEPPRVAPPAPSNNAAILMPALPAAGPAPVQPANPPPSPRPNRVITAIVAASGNQSLVISPGQSATLVSPTAGGGSDINSPGQPPSQVVRIPGGVSTIYTPGEAPTTVTPIAGGGSIIAPPGQPPSTVVPNGSGGSTVYTPGEAPTLIVPIAGGGSIIYAPGQAPVTVMPTN